jgi:tetratricopeptide (TPR) repeat protein
LGIDEPHRKWLRAVLEAAEPDDDWSRKAREACAEKDDARRRAALEKLAASADFAKVPARALTQLAGALAPAPRVELLRRAQAQNPADFWVNHNLGIALHTATPPEHAEAVRFLTAAVALRPDSAGACLNLGNTLQDKGQVDEAIACFKKAIALDPKYAEVHCNLGRALTSQGRFAESLAAYQRGHELGTKQSGWRHPSAEWVSQAERMAALEAKLPAFLKGEFQPKDATERLGLVGVCHAKKFHHAATRLYVDAFAADRKLTDDLEAGHRYNAAFHAALAADGQGEDAAKLDDAAKAKLRGQALDWLKAERTALTNHLDSGLPQARPTIVQILSHWQQDTDLAGIRDAAALAKLPADEQKAFTQLWADVAALLNKAEGKPSPSPAAKDPEKTPETAPPPREKK